MLNTIIAQFLNISTEQANGLLEILKFEKHFEKDQEHKDQKISPKDIRTQEEFISFLQIVGQAKWFKGFDRTQLPTNIDDKELLQKYYNMFKQYGMIDESKYVSAEKPDFSLVLGSSESVVTLRTKTMVEDLKAGLIPNEGLIFGLGCNRLLGSSAFNEEISRDKLLTQKKEPTEMEMVTLIVQQSIENFNTLNKQKLTYQAVNVSARAQDRLDPTCIKTGDTAFELKKILESHEKFSEFKKPVRLAAYSNAPFIRRQILDVQNKLGDHFQVTGVGPALTFQEFSGNARSISTCLKEIASECNIKFNNKEFLKHFAVSLTQEELNELAALCSSQKKTKEIPPPTYSDKLSILGHFGSISDSRINPEKDAKAQNTSETVIPAPSYGRS